MQPLATSLHPSRSIFPSVDASSELPARRRKALGLLAVASAVVVVGAGAASMTNSHPRSERLTREVVSGRAGLRTTSTGADEAWAPSNPPAFVLDPSLDTMDPNAKAAIIDAFSTWDGANLGVPRASFTISSTRGKAVQDGVSRIVYAPIEVEGMEDALAITIGYANGSTGVIGEADVIFNSKYTFHVFSASAAASDEACNGDYDVQNVATHEAGHVYGLGEDMNDTSTTMYVRSGACETHKRVLTESDKQVMSGLYTQTNAAAAASAADSKAAGCGGATIAAHRPGSSGWGWIATGLAALIPLRRRRAGQEDVKKA